MILAGCFLYFGALLIPAIFFLSNRDRGKVRRLMWIGVGLQVIWSFVVAAIVYFSWRSGNRDAFMAWGLLLPVNFISFIYFSGVFFIYCREKNKK
jgi:ABC-type cobalamin transport system permease subunit